MLQWNNKTLLVELSLWVATEYKIEVQATYLQIQWKYSLDWDYPPASTSLSHIDKKYWQSSSYILFRGITKSDDVMNMKH